jgi:hypothetical protein
MEIAAAPVTGSAPRRTLGARLRTGALVALAFGSSLMPLSSRAAVVGAVPAGPVGAPVSWVAEAPGPGRALLDAQAPLQEALSTARRAQDQANGDVTALKSRLFSLERRVAELQDLLQWPAAPPSGSTSPSPGSPSPTRDPRLAVFDAVLAQGPDHAAALAEARAEQADLQARLPDALARLAAADREVAQLVAALEALDAKAWPVLGALGVSPQALAAARDGGLGARPGAVARAAGLLELWLEHLDGPPRAGPQTPAELYAFLVASRPDLPEALAANPDLFASPYDVLYAGTAPSAPGAEALARARGLAAAVGYRPMADDLGALGRLSPEAHATFAAFLGELSQAGLTFERRYAAFGPLSTQVQGELTRLLAALPWQTPEGRAKTRAAAELLDSAGVPLTPAQAVLLGTLARGGPMAERALALVRGAAPFTDPRDGDYVVFVARAPDRFGGAEVLSARLEAMAARLGRRPTVPEAAQLLEAMAAGSPLAALLPEGGAGLPAGDQYTWTRAPARYTGASGDALRASLDARVGQPVLRMDSNAEYVETSSAAFTAPQLIKMHLLLDALADPGTRARLADALDADLKDGAQETGGLVRIEAGRARFDVLASAGADPNDATYLLPSAEEPLLALAKFHFHAVNTRGEAARSGPSSVAAGQGADVGVAYLYQQDEVVVSASAVDAAGRVLRFNVDFVSKDGAVRDLGTFTR